MTKQGLIYAIATRTGLSNANSQKALDAILDNIKAAMNKGENVQLLGFGTFSVDERAAREGRNPRTGETMTIEAKKVVKWKASKGLLE